MPKYVQEKVVLHFRKADQAYSERVAKSLGLSEGREA